MMMKRTSLILLLVFLTGCALNGTARHKAVVADTGLYTAIAAVDDLEMSLSQSGAITPVQHRELNPKIVALLKAGQSANSAIVVWPQGQPAPRELVAAAVELGKVADAVISALPDGATKSKLQSAVMKAQTIAALLLALLPSTTGGTAEMRLEPCYWWLTQSTYFRDVNPQLAQAIERRCGRRLP